MRHPVLELVVELDRERDERLRQQCRQAEARRHGVSAL
jgi:hypothetical protein